MKPVAPQVKVEWETPPQQPEGIRWRRILWIVGATLTLFAGSVAIVWWMGWSIASDRNPNFQSVPPQISQQTINLLEQVPFPIAMRGVLERHEELRRLGGWGWVDRQRGIIHEPVELEMAKIVAEQGASAHGAARGGGP